ncbi:MAG: amino acid--tRNA ligase-related protein [Ruminococcus sp.]
MRDIMMHLRNPVVQKNLDMVRRIKQTARYFLEQRGFAEYDTPILQQKGGERYNPTFDVQMDGYPVCLGDSPQMYKMLLLHAGYDRYYQFAHCFRPIAHETHRETRLCEFMQLDLEMQVSSLEELLSFAQSLLGTILHALSIHGKISVMDGLTCREIYGDEMKPDCRQNQKDISVVFLKRMPLTNGEKMPDGTWIPCHHIFAQPSGEIGDMSEAALLQMTTESFDVVVNGIEVGGGDLRIMQRSLQEQMMDIFHVETGKYRQYLEQLDNAGTLQIGGFAFGLERLVQALSGCSNIRQTVPFYPFDERKNDDA